MIITRTPFRLSFFGGGSDYSLYQDGGNVGAVVGCAINKYCFITYRRMPPLYEHRNRIVYGNVEYTDDIASIRHPGVRETLRYMQVRDGIEIHHTGDLPARSGVGSSSAFVVGLLNAVYASKGIKPWPRTLALEAYHVEHEMAGEVVGYQDQVLTAHGGFRHVVFRDHGFEVKEADVTGERISELMSHVMLAFTGSTRVSSSVAATYIDNMGSRRAEMSRTVEMVGEALSILRGRGPMAAFGRLMHESWELKKRRGSGISNPRLDAVYGTARDRGAYGGKVIGAGSAGFMMFVAPPDAHAGIGRALVEHGCTVVPVGYEPGGSRVIYNDEAETR